MEPLQTETVSLCYRPVVQQLDENERRLATLAADQAPSSPSLPLPPASSSLPLPPVQENRSQEAFGQPFGGEVVWSHGTGLIITPQKSLKSYRLFEMRHHMYHHNVSYIDAGMYFITHKHVPRLRKSSEFLSDKSREVYY